MLGSQSVHNNDTLSKERLSRGPIGSRLGYREATEIHKVGIISTNGCDKLNGHLLVLADQSEGFTLVWYNILIKIIPNLTSPYIVRNPRSVP